jgi:segregation and condensation protein B
MRPESETPPVGDAPPPAVAEDPTEAAAEGVEDRSGMEESLFDVTVEAILFSAEVPLPARKIADLTSSSKRDVVAAVDRLNVFYGETKRAFRVATIAGGFQLVTTPDHAELLSKLHKERVPTRLSRAALETLAIIAFKQPVTRAEIDAIRGVSASDRVLRTLMDRKLVRISGRAEAPGRPLLYGTTREFLAYFGLESVADLPRTDELAALLAGEVPGTAAEDEDTESRETELGEEIARRGVPPMSPAHVWTEAELSHSGEESDADDEIPET